MPDLKQTIKNLRSIAAWCGRAADEFEKFSKEHAMGRVAVTVNRLEAEKAQLKQQVADLQGQLQTAQANSLDADDLAALSTADQDTVQAGAGGGNPATLPAGSGNDTTGGAGASTLPAAAGGDTLAGGAGAANQPVVTNDAATVKQ